MRTDFNRSKVFLTAGVMLFTSMLFSSCVKNTNVSPAAKQTLNNKIVNGTSFDATSTLTDGLIGYWTLSAHGNTVYDYAPYIYYPGTTQNTTSITDRFGNINGALLFNGTNSMVTINDAVPLRLNNTDYTINIWARFDFNYLTDPHYYWTILNKCGSTSTNNTGYFECVGGFGLVNGVNALAVPSFSPNGTQYQLNAAMINGTDPTTTRKWHMITVTYSASHKVLLEFFDGVYVKMYGMVASPANTSNALNIGGGITSGFIPFKGALNDLRIYNRAITFAEVSQLYTYVDSNH